MRPSFRRHTDARHAVVKADNDRDRVPSRTGAVKFSCTPVSGSTHPRRTTLTDDDDSFVKWFVCALMFHFFRLELAAAISDSRYFSFVSFADGRLRGNPVPWLGSDGGKAPWVEAEMAVTERFC